MFRYSHDSGDARAAYAGSNPCTRSAEPPPRACRFLLTFDDGPDTSPALTSSVVLERLAKNKVQPHIKAIFFVQTRNSGGGGTEYGRFLLRREHNEGHVLGLHSGTARGHVSHIGMGTQELKQSLQDGMEDIRRISGHRPSFVRPPYWLFSRNTLAQYESQGLHMLLSDMKAYDGVNWGIHLFRRLNIKSGLRKIGRGYLRRTLQGVNGYAPVILTFHDTNAYTGRHLDEYLSILLEEAERLRIPLHEKPFYDNASEISAAALRRAVHPSRRISSVGSQR